MKISVRWLNEYLDPAGVTAEAAEQALTHAGLPIETVTQVGGGGGDVMVDVEVTSNRGDCLSHIGVAREVAAATGRKLVMPKVPAPPMAAAGKAGRPAARLENRVPEACRLFTARVIKGVKIGPSPAWMVRALEAVGQRSISNIVDITNYVQYEFGQPTHVFDLAKVRAGGADGVPHVIVRFAKDGEKLTLLDGKSVTLKEGELVVADPGGAISLAGIMGGAGSEVSAATTDVLLEAATWDPATVRRAARRMQLRTDASHRFERLVDPRTIEPAARRAAALIVELGGGTLLPGVLSEGAAPEAATRVSMRTRRCREVLGVDIPTAEMVRALRAHQIEVAEPTGKGKGEEALECVVPPFRPDLTREIDLVEEVARTNTSAKGSAAGGGTSVGALDRLPIHETMSVRVAAPQESERAMRELGVVLAGMGFFETITFSFVAPAAAAPFLPAGLEALNLCDERRKADPTLRPSIVPSLLACRRANQDGGVTNAGGVRLFEVASVFAQEPAAGVKGGHGKEREARVLALVADAVAATPGGKAFEARQDTIRLLRGVLEGAARALGGAEAKIEVVPAALPMSGYDAAASAEVRLNGKRIGVLGMVSQKVQQTYDLHTPVGAAEVDVGALVGLYPPRSTAHALPAFPGIERDLSLIVGEDVAWGSIESLIAGAGLGRLDGWEFVTTYRGQQAGAGKKSVTVRLRFRDPARTLRHEEVDPQVASLVKLAGEKLGATLRV